MGTNKRDANHPNENEERLKLILEATDAGVWDWHIQSREVNLDKKWADIFGYTLKELLSIDIKMWYKFIHPDDRKKFDLALEEHFAKKKKQFEFESRIKHKNSDWIWILIKGKVIEWDKDENPVRMVGIIINITEKKKVQNALLESESRFRTTFDNAIDPIFIAKIEKGNVPIIYDINSVVTKKLGYSKDELVGKPMEILHPNEKRKNILKRVKKILAGEQLHFESEHIKKDGTIIPVEMSAKIIKTNGKNYIYIIERDISERKKREKEILNAHKKLQEENANKDKFFSIISHDLKSPFGALLAVIQLLEENYEEMNDKERKELIHVARTSAKNIYELLEGLLEWSRAKSDKIDFSPSIINLEEISSQVIQIFSQSAKNKKITIINEIENNSFAYADEKMCRTILRNLIANAIKFTPRGRKIIVSSNMLNDKIEVSVKDNGIGMSKEDTEKLFRIDVHHTTLGTENESGTGVGLILCKELIEKCGGDIWVESELGKGSVFRFTLPIESTAVGK